ncbi:MAG: DUF1549 domain-containing protein, partial [Planctomycetaceae bacterium]|nr:DUF1549 domain-containing protein [Planctomycetaceae bacterium]
MNGCRVIVLVLFCVVCSPPSRAEDSLRSVVDQRMAAVAGFVPATCSDSEFLRRVSLDLIGMPPTADEARVFLADSNADKREQLADRLLASPHYFRHLAATLDVMLMERRANTHVSADEWTVWLLKSVRENKPWNVLAREILSADGDDPAMRPAARFALDRGAEPNLLTHDISRIFFGRDVQCAQCHDHPLVSDYLQADYQGLLAFVAPSYAVVRKEGDKDVTVIAERAGSDLTFESVFSKGTPHRTGPRLPGGTAIDEPLFLPGEEYVTAPADAVKSVPKFSRRQQLAELATGGQNDAFNRNIANRLWAHLFGRGLVHPVDMHHPDNPPTDPELLQQLSDHFAATGFDIRAFLRELVLSETYQRTFDLPSDLISAANQVASGSESVRNQQSLLKEQAATDAKAYSAAIDAWHAAEAGVIPVAGEVDAARNSYAEARKKADEARAALAAVTAQQQSKQSAADALQAAATAAKSAAAVLPDDAVLPEAVAELVVRAERLAGEAVGLNPMVEEKTAALKPLADAQEAAKPPIDAAVAKLAQLRTAMNQSEQSMVNARRQSAASSRLLTSLEERSVYGKQFAELPQQHQAVVAAVTAAGESETRLTAAQQQVAEYMPMIAQADSAVRTAAERRTAAAEVLNAVRTESGRKQQLAEALAAALASAERAQQSLSGDRSLAEAVVDLRTQASSAAAGMNQSQAVVTSAEVAMTEAETAVTQAKDTQTERSAEMQRRQQSMSEASHAATVAKDELTTRRAEWDSGVTDVGDRMVVNFTTAALKPLTPEQLCWSVFQVTGVYGRYWQAEITELDKTSPLTEEQKQDPTALVARNAELEQRVYDKLKGNIGLFVTFYGAAAGQPQGDFFSTADQALFTANGGPINSWVAPAGDNVTDRIIKQPDARIAAEELYLGVLTRMPTEQEISEVNAHLAGRTDDRAIAAQALVWAVLNSAEFRFSHCV